MNNKTYLLLADAFGYGPITTLINVAKELKKQNIKLVFIGPLFCIEKIEKENICDEYIHCDYSCNSVDKNIYYFKSADKIIAVETTDILIYLINKYELKNLYLIDNLFWMWDFLESELKELKKYYISNVIPCDENIRRIANGFNNIEQVGSLRSIKRFKRIKDNNLMISLGGAKSYLIDSSITNDFYIKCIQIILGNEHIKKFKKIYIAGGKNLISVIKNKVKLNNNVEIGSFNNEEYLKRLYKCSYAIMAPGLGNFNEVISTNINVMFLLPINYSQYLQRIKYKEIYRTFNYQDNNNEKSISEYLEESIGVNKVIDNLKSYTFNTFNKELNDYFESNIDEIKRYELYKNIDKNGIKEIVNDLI